MSRAEKRLREVLAWVQSARAEMNVIASDVRHRSLPDAITDRLRLVEGDLDRAITTYRRYLDDDIGHDTAAAPVSEGSDES